MTVSTKIETAGETIVALLDAAKLIARLPEHDEIEVEADTGGVWVWENAVQLVIDTLGPFDLTGDDGQGTFAVARVGLVRVALDRSGMAAS